MIPFLKHRTCRGGHIRYYCPVTYLFTYLPTHTAPPQLSAGDGSSDGRYRLHESQEARDGIAFRVVSSSGCSGVAAWEAKRQWRRQRRRRSGVPLGLGHGRYRSSRHRMPSNYYFGGTHCVSMARLAIILAFCSPRHRMLFNSILQVNTCAG
jgi:hypothetical protein